MCLCALCGSVAVFTSCLVCLSTPSDFLCLHCELQQPHVCNQSTASDLLTEGELQYQMQHQEIPFSESHCASLVVL